jgi:putative transposase
MARADLPQQKARFARRHNSEEQRIMNHADGRGLSSNERRAIYRAAGMSSASVSLVETMVAAAGRRDVGRGALRNVVVEFQSKKNGVAHIVESHTCELIFAYECELDPAVRGYYAQVPCPYVERLRGGRRHVSAATLDFLVFRSNKVQLVECKTLEWLGAEVKKSKTDWQHMDGCWRNIALEPYASSREIEFVAWHPPSIAGIYLQNLQACYAVAGETPPPRRVVDAAAERIRRRPSTVEELTNCIAGFSPRTALWMLATRAAYGPWWCISVSAIEEFVLFSDAAQAELANVTGMSQLDEVIAQPKISDPVCLASATDLARGRKRLERLGRMTRGEEPWSRRYRALRDQVRDGEDNGKSPLEVCLTSYHSSGNRVNRLLHAHYEACGKVLRTAWESGDVSRPLDLYFALEAECRNQGIEPCSRWLLDTMRRNLASAKRALKTSGMRGFQATRASTDPRFRSLAPIGYGAVLHVDSSKFDVRLLVKDNGDTVKLAANIYVAVDGASGRIMAHSLIFGAARTDGLALLMRDYVRRHGVLPVMIHLDRGSENKSNWLKSFCLGRISIRRSPTAGSAWNSLAEEAIKQINDQVAHRLPGSTFPDQAGRNIDGRFKSYRTAKLTMALAHKELVSFLYGDSNERLGIDGLTVSERAASLAETFGQFGTPCAFDDAFAYATSLPMQLRKKFNKRRGIRTEDGWFTSKELQEATRANPIDEVRTDCERQEVLYVKVNGTIIKAYHSAILSMARMDAMDQQIELQFKPIARRLSRLQRVNGGRKRHTRFEYSKMRVEDESRAECNQHVDGNEAASTTSDSSMSASDKGPAVTLSREWRFDDLQPFPEEGSQ